MVCKECAYFGKMLSTSARIVTLSDFLQWTSRLANATMMTALRTTTTTMRTTTSMTMWTRLFMTRIRDVIATNEGE